MCRCCCYLSQCKGPTVVFEFVLNRPQLSECREIWERLQPADGSFELVLVLNHKKLQQTEHLQGKSENVLIRHV